MVDGVKSFRSVKKEKKLVLFLLDCFVKKVVDLDNVFRTLSSSNKTFLRGVHVGVHGRHDAPRNARRQDPVVSVGDAEGPGVRNKTGELFWEEEEETVVETVGRGLTLEDGF